MKPSPLISVIVTCYNQEQYLSQTLQSVVNQTYTNWECIVVNDGSTDQTRAIADGWQQKDTRIQCIHKPNGGVSSARNIALSHAKGAYIQFLDGDDILDPTKLEQAILFPQADIIITHFAMFEDNPQKLLPPFCELSQFMLNYDHVLTQWDLNFNIPIHTGIFSSRALNNFRFNEELKAKEDWMLWLFAFKPNPSVVFIDKPLALYRMHPQNMTKDVDHMNAYTILSYEFLYGQLDSRDKQLLFTKMLNLYAQELLSQSAKSIEFRELLTGKKKLGIIGTFMFRLLRKTGHVFINRKNQSE